MVLLFPCIQLNIQGSEELNSDCFASQEVGMAKEGVWPEVPDLNCY
jgi:hypothetical protein